MNLNRLFTILILLTAIFASACSSGEEKNVQKKEDKYASAVSDFYVSLAAIQTDQAPFAFSKMNEVAKTYPEEPAAWANLGVFAMRQGNYELAAEQLQKALNLAPDNTDILLLAALLERNRRNTEKSIAYLRKILQQDTSHVRAQYLLATELEQLDFKENQQRITELLLQLSKQLPDNQSVLLDLIRIEIKKGNLDRAQEYLNKLGEQSEQWQSSTRQQYRQVVSILKEGNTSELNLQLALLRNQLQTHPQFTADVHQLKFPDNQVGFLIKEFISLPQPEVKTPPPDTTLSFQVQPATGVTSERVRFINSVVLNENAPPLLAVIEGAELKIDTLDAMSFPDQSDQPLSFHALALMDLNYDFRNDIVIVGRDGFRLYRQNDGLSFENITETLALPSSITNGSYKHVWTADLDVDGDLDVVLVTGNGRVSVLRNNGDNTFRPVTNYFPGITDPVNFLWADLDADLDPDAAFLTSGGQIIILQNERSGKFRRVDSLPNSAGIGAFTFTDINADSQFDIIALQQEGSIARLFLNNKNGRWQSESLTKDIGQSNNMAPGNTSLFAEDVDNNGRIDIITSSTSESILFLQGDNNSFNRIELAQSGRISTIVDVDGDQRLDLVGRESTGVPFQLMNSGSQEYHARSIRTRASDTSGDRRINSFAIGGQLEIRSGLLYQKQPIRSPIVHFGLGKYEDTEMLRIIWPNGSVQAEFAELGIGSTIFNKQLLKGSCPWLFAHNGEEFEFVTDILWRSPLGLRINAQETAGVIQTKDRVRIPGQKLKAEEGKYKLRITAELWETHFFDMVKVLAVDHPEDTEIFLDERFSFPPPDLRVHQMTKPKPVERVTNGSGEDVTEKIRSVDQKYLHAFTQTKYQGVVNEHSIIIELGEEAPAEGPLWLLAHGWVRPTDSSINFALSQGDHPFPKGLKIETSSDGSSWKTLHADYGFPAGKTKTILIDLTNVFETSKSRKIRFTTSAEIYWNAFQWAIGKRGAPSVTRELEPVKMNLAYRGYSEWNKESDFHPLLPNYNKIRGTTPKWHDLKGYYTRFGPVGELLKTVDDRYVIMNAGDEIQLAFKALEPPREGYERDFILVSDGWIKDGDLNTRFSKTVWPLPSHDRKKYTTDYERLADDPVYQEHKEDWAKYHTRYIEPLLFQKSLQILTP